MRGSSDGGGRPAGPTPGAADVQPAFDPAPPLPGPVLMTQDWQDVAFLHWAVEPAAVRRWMPPGVEPDVLDGVTYVGLIPFRMVGAGLGSGPAVPWLGTFWETNVRLYSRDATGRRGIVFRSLDASRLGVVLAARAAFGLPYRWARMRGGQRARAGALEVAYATTLRRPARRSHAAADHVPASRVAVRVGERLTDTSPDAALASFLTARWGLHERHAGRTWYVPNEHGPWPLHSAEVLRLDDDLLAAAGFPDLATRPPDHVAWSPGVRTRFGLPYEAARPRS